MQCIFFLKLLVESKRYFALTLLRAQLVTKMQLHHIFTFKKNWFIINLSYWRVSFSSSEMKTIVIVIDKENKNKQMPIREKIE